MYMYCHLMHGLYIILIFDCTDQGEVACYHRTVESWPSKRVNNIPCGTCVLFGC